MPRVPIASEDERKFIVDGIQSNFRNDGRNCRAYRPLLLATDVITTANGSCLLKLGGTVVMVGVTFEFSRASQEKPNEGRIEATVDGSGCRSLRIFGRHRRQYTKQIARSLNYILNNSKCFDLSQLCVVKGHHCWLVHVDISVLRYEGNLHDACSFAMKAALSETKVPALKVVHDEETNEVSVDVCDDPYEYGVLDVSKLPLLITVGQINGVHTVDTTIKEDSVTLARITYGIIPSGSIVYMNKDGGGSLDLLNIRSMTKIASEIGPQLNELLMKKVQLSKDKQASWGHANERLLFDDDNFV
ncbi:unnamed protein product [Rotaria socialis]|uniref:Ribosomal RNA-processing protein 42 n=2 Tax=Rotaria socialis TaxID=392032 RepID=A0A818V604_9BILA|nr:unnamed protein product [Rotaria socialis]CAF3660390.1 unnamed protein product [Rotaria socialis]CAF3710478.1 unnamed protein product [Rotaria socialis]